MKILVLGNGFDVDHGLPTSYANFLAFCNAVVNISLYPEAGCFRDLTEIQKKYIKTLTNDDILREQFLKLFQYMQRQRVLILKIFMMNIVMTYT